MALFSMALLVGPVLGPIIGGWLTENYSWRFIFYINLPIGLLALFGMMTFLKDTARDVAAKLDWFGFGTLSVTIAAFQILLDRGEELDWFGSSEIILEAIIAASALYLFLVHTFTARAPFVRPSLFRNRNYAAGALFGIIIGLTYYASLALQPPYLQNLMGYPIVTAGLVLGPRGVGTIGALMIVGRLVGRVDTRLLLAIGLGLTAWAFWVMTGWNPDVSQGTIIGVGVVQGIGLGFLTVPVNVVTLSSLLPEARAEGAGFSTLARNMGSSAGISIVNSLLTRNTQVNHSEIASHVTSINRAFENPVIRQFWNPATAAGRAALDAVITRQAQIIAYIDDYKLLMIATLAVAPLLVVFAKPSRDVAPDHAQPVE
jgi:DHA2 family multidrug resistance protein